MRAAAVPSKGGEDAAIKEAIHIFKGYQRRMKEDTQFAALGYQDRFDYIMKQHVDFTRSFPVVVRIICTVGLFHPKALKLYISKCQAKKADTDEAFAERQADYVKYVYMYSFKGMARNKLQAIWRDTKESILEEMKHHKKSLEAIQKRREAAKSDNLQIRRNRLRTMLAAKKRYDSLPEDKKYTRGFYPARDGVKPPPIAGPAAEKEITELESSETLRAIQ